MRVAWLALGCLSACATIGPGKPLTELPPGLSWCGKGPGPVDNTTGEGSSEKPAISSAVALACSPLLQRHEELMSEPWRGSIIYALSSDASGRVVDICVYGGNFGNVTDYVGCVAEQVKRNVVLEPNRKRWDWRLTYVVD